MKVRDLIVKLSMMDPEKEVYIDMTDDSIELFKFEAAEYAEEIEASTGEEIVLISSIEYSGDNEEDDNSFLDN